MAKKLHIPLKFWITFATLVLLLVVVYLNFGQMSEAMTIVKEKSLNLSILALILPVQALSYFAKGRVTFLYLRSKGEKISQIQTTRIAIEASFIDHVAFFSNVAGVSYYCWRLSHNGISLGRATFTQILNYLLAFTSSVLILFGSVIFLILNHGNNTIIIAGTILILVTIILLFSVAYITRGNRHVENFSIWLSKVINKVVFVFTIGKKKNIVSQISLQNFFSEVNKDYTEIMSSKKDLIRPFSWSLIASILDASLVFIIFSSKGIMVSPIVIYIAVSLSGYACVASFTPGGAGIYETCMIYLLATAGISANSAIAGTLLARTILLIIILVFGSILCINTVTKYGRPDGKTKKEKQPKKQVEVILEETD